MKAVTMLPRTPHSCRLLRLAPGLILIACATEAIDTSGEPVAAGGEDAGMGRDTAPEGNDAQPAEALDAAPERDVSVSSDPWAPGTIPPGPPPTHCLAPCLYETMVACGVPGAGAPLPDPATCRHSEVGLDLILCDLEAEYLIVSDKTVYHEGSECFRVIGQVCCGAQRPYHSWFDSSGELIAEIEFGQVGSGGGPIRTYCGSADDPSSAVYDMNTEDPACAVWNYIRGFPNSATAEFTTEPHIYCPPGECPEPPAPPVGGDQ